MEESELQALERTSRLLATGILLTDQMLAALVQEGVLDLVLMESVQAERTNTERVLKLLQLLPRRKPGTFDTFVSVLREDYSWLADKLREEHDNIVAEEEKRRQTQFHQAKKTGGVHHDAAYATSLADIRKLVGTRIHKLFGQSRKISEKEKHALERWLSHEIWRQRCQAVAELESQSPVPDMHREQSSLSLSHHDPDHVDGKNGLAPATQKQLFPIYLRLESAGVGGEKEQLMPQDMTWELLDKMIIEVLDRVTSLEEERESCLDYFRSTGMLGPGEPASLSQLIKNLVATQERTRAESKRLQTKLDRQERELDACAEHIKKLEDERTRLRTENKRQTADFAQLKLSHDQLAARCQELEQMKKLTLEREHTIEKLKLRVSQLEKTNSNDPVARKRLLMPLHQGAENRWAGTATGSRAKDASPERSKRTFRTRRKVVKKKNNAP